MVPKNIKKFRPVHTASSNLVATCKLVAKSKFKFTEKALNALRKPTGGQWAYSYDLGVRGLAIGVSPRTGSKTFVLYRKVDGKPERIKLGHYPDMSIEQARGKAEENNSAISRGENPAAQKRTLRAEMTLGELFNYWLTEYAQAEKKSWKNDANLFKNHLHGWSLKRISEIRKSDVVTLKGKIGRASGRYVANRTIELLCSIFNRAIDSWGWQGENPAAEIEAFPEKKRDRFLEADELPRLFQSLKDEPNATVRDFVLLCLFCGARRANTQSMRWDELHLDRHIWRIPETKNGEPQDVYLPPPALAILASRQEQANGSPWVFPGKGRTGHLVEPKSCWKRILKRAGLVDVRMHDLRRSLGSWEAATGASLPIIGKTLGHRSPSATAIYARLDLNPVRNAVDRATEAMLVASRTPRLLEGT